MKTARIEFLLTTFLLSFFMTFIVSGMSTLTGIGLTPDFFMLWGKAWISSWIVAFPAVFFVLPIVRRLVHKLVNKLEGNSL